MATDFIGKGNGNAMVPSSSAARMGERVRDANGDEFIYCYSPGVLAANTAYAIRPTATATTDPQLVAIASGALYHTIGVIDQATTTGDRIFAKVKGDATVAVATATYTANYGVMVSAGAVAVFGTTDAASHLSNKTFGIVKTTQTTAATTACNVRLLGTTALAAA